MAENWTLWGKTDAGVEYGAFLLQNDILKLRVTNAGAAIVEVQVPDKEGNWGNVVVTPPHPDYFLTNASSLGATCGRFANRIGKGTFSLDGETYQLATNNGPNHLHGGVKGFAKRIWKAVAATPDSATFRLVSPDGDQGYPGELTTTLTYRIHKGELTLDYTAATTAPTVLNLTNHAYWNLDGGGLVYDHLLQLQADRVLENDANVLPTGKILDVAGTPFDFRSPQTIGSRIEQVGNGYDNCFVINDWDQTLRQAAVVTTAKSGRKMEILTTEPGIQLYTANHFNKSEASAGWDRHTSFCLECQHLPDSPNQPAFPSTVLRPGETYRQTTVHRFSLT